MDSSVVFVANNPVKMEMQYQLCPFQIVLKETNAVTKQNLGSGISMVVSSQKPFWFNSFWGCDIASFHQAVALHWKDLRKHTREGTLFSGKCLETREPELCFESEREVMIKSRKNLNEKDLGPSPRSTFPLVLVMVLHQEYEEEELKPTDVVALICAVHVQDSICTSESTFVFKLSKLANGQVLNVTKVFTRDEENAIVCLVCESERVTIGLLPCRHFSLCKTCYDLLPSPKQCPVCRSYITRFFEHGTELNEPFSQRPIESTEHQESTEIESPEAQENQRTGFIKKIRNLFS
jgi:hypothetical protein